MNMYDLVKNSEPPSAALTALPIPGHITQTAWLLRRTSADIETLKTNPNPRFEQRPGIYRATIDGKSVELLFVLLAVGTEPFDPSWIHLAFAGNEHQHGVYGGLLENLTTQDTIAIAIIGDSGNIELDGTIPNTIRQFAREGLADMSKLAPWSDEEWRAAILFFQRENPDILGLWNRFSHLPRTDFD